MSKYIHEGKKVSNEYPNIFSLKKSMIIRIYTHIQIFATHHHVSKPIYLLQDKYIYFQI